jgi:hypothetical protein
MKQERTMKSYWLPALLVVLAAGCTPAPSSSGPVSNTSSSDLSISVPDTPGGQSDDAAANANTTLVSLNIPGMT